MQYYRCKCGSAESWTSMGVPRCRSCSKCGSDLAQGPNGHRDPAPHEYVTRYDEHTGKPYEVCLGCDRKREEIGAAAPADGGAP